MEDDPRSVVSFAPEEDATDDDVSMAESVQETKPTISMRKNAQHQLQALRKQRDTMVGMLNEFPSMRTTMQEVEAKIDLAEQYLQECVPLHLQIRKLESKIFNQNTRYAKVVERKDILTERGRYSQGPRPM